MSLAVKEFGPYPSKARTLAAAIKTAKLAETAGRTARVQEQTGGVTFKQHWPKPRGKGGRRLSAG